MPTFSITKTDFSNTSDLSLNGIAGQAVTQAGTILRLTPDLQNQSGSAYLKTAMAVNTNTSFQSRFQFRLAGAQGTGGADGFAFVLQNSAAGATALGTVGGGLGYSGATPQSLAIEFDTFKSGWDSNNNHISVLRDGDVSTALATTTASILDLNSGAALNAWVDYDGVTDRLDVFLSSTTVKPSSAVLSYSVDLSTVLNGNAFVGFTAGTGGLSNTQDIENWDLTISTPSADSTIPTASLTATNVFPESGSSHTFVVTYRDNGAIARSTIDDTDIRVTGPGGFSQLATLVGVSETGDGSPRTATYRITAPGGSWDQADNGTYAIAVRANQVTDSQGNGIAGTTLGSFAVNLTSTSVNGTNGADDRTGNDLNNVLRGYAGNDRLLGLAGNDVFMGDTGNDVFNGGTGRDTVNYADATNSVVVDLTAGFASRTARLMPLGDSITLGISVSAALADRSKVAGYRYVLSNKFIQDGLTVDFVGTQSTGPDDMADKDHEGHGGETINEINVGTTRGGRSSPGLNYYLSTGKPDIVTLMAGTNDTFFKASAAQMRTDLSNLIDKITAFSPDIRILVASIPPIRDDAFDSPGVINADSLQQVKTGEDFSNTLPGLVAEKRAAGQNVDFVDMRSSDPRSTVSSGGGLNLADISPRDQDSGVHPNAQGYTKIGNFWYNSLAKIGTAQGTYKVDQDKLLSIENIVGSAYNDTLIGNSGANYFEGGSGRDRLTGKAGNDQFIYKYASDGGDEITDFQLGDLFRISASGFDPAKGLKSGISLSTTASTRGTLVNGSTSISANATFLYTNNVLRFDADGTGSGASVMIARLTGGPQTLDVSQFRIVA